MERSTFSFSKSDSASDSDSGDVRAPKTEFVATFSRSYYVSSRSIDEDDAILPVRTTDATDFSATVSFESTLRRKKKRETIPLSPLSPLENRNVERLTSTPFVPLGLAGLTLPQLERAAILETLLLCGGRRRQAARKLGVSEKTIYNKIKTYRLQPELDAAACRNCLPNDFT